MTDKEFFKKLKKECTEHSEQISEGFPYFCLKVFFPQLSQDDTENAIYGLGRNDESIDAFFIDDENREINFIQFKSVRSLENMRVVEKDSLSYLYDIPNKLENSNYIDKHSNLKIKDIAADYSCGKKSKFETKFHFFHLGYIQNEDILKSYKNYFYYDFKRIKEEYYEYQSKISLTEPEFIVIKLPYDKKPEKIEQKIGNHNTFIGIITGDEIVRLRQEFKYKLFDKNLRFSLGNNKINKKISKSASSDKGNFYFYNNGITITSRSFRYKENTNSIRIGYPQIINGAQSVNSIFSAYNERFNQLKRELGNEKQATEKTKKEFNEIQILFRIIRTKEQEQDFEREVIEANNTQNVIQKRDFYANAQEQKDLQKYFAKYGYFYEIKRGDRDYIKKEKHNILHKKLSEFKFKDEKTNIETLASLWMAYYVQEPNQREVGKERIFGADKYYDLLFKDESIDDLMVKEMILAYNCYDLINNEAKIYRGTNSILNLLSIIDKRENFEKAKKIVNRSVIFNQTLKSKFDDFEKFNSNKDTYIKKIRNYSVFSQGKYMVLAIFKLIIDECDYLDTLLNLGFFSNKDFLYENVVKKWLIVILDKLLILEYETFTKNVGGSIGAFYLKTNTYDNIKARFKILDVDLDKEYKDIFPIQIT